MDKHGTVSQLFNKKFQFNSFTDVPQKIFASPKWSISTLQKKKIELNNVKAQLGKYNLEEWSRHTKRNDPSSFIIRFLRQKVEPELLTQAWCKFYECLSQFEIIPSLNQMKEVDKYTTLHLCEAPGAFIAALNHYSILNYDNFVWEWIATTLNPNYEGNKLSEMIPDDRLCRVSKEKWYFGIDGTGDITKYYNYVDLLKHVGKKMWLVTADGSVDCMSDPGNQESCVEYLHYCEVITALSVLHEGGTFVLKIFTMFEDSTICLLYLLNILFESVTAFKPCTSKGGNSEVYLICTRFKGCELIDDTWEALKEPYVNGCFSKEVSMFDLEEIPRQFLSNIEQCADFFMNLQIETITNNIDNFKKRDSLYLSLIHHTKIRVANMFLKKYRVKKILPTFKLIPLIDINSYNFKTSSDPKLLSEYKSDALVHFELENVICIKYGKKIEKLGFSRYCDLQDCHKLNIFRKGFQDHCSLYNRAYMDVSGEYLIVNRNDFDCYLYCDFQRQFFNFFVCHELDKSLIILDVPLVTNVLVGFFYLLCNLYEEISVHLNGCVVLSKLKPEAKSKLGYLNGVIKDAYDNIPKNVPFQVDIIEIVPTNLILYNNFYDLVYNYNNSLLKRIKS